MAMLDARQYAALLLFLIATMGALGLQVGLRDFQRIGRRKSLFIRSLLLNFVAIPALGLLVIQLLPMPPATADAILLLAFAPGGLSAVQFTSKRRDVLAFAGQLALLLTFLSVVLTPLMLAFFLEERIDIVVPYARTFWFLAAFYLAPLGAGIFIRDRLPGLAARLAKPMALIGTLAFAAFVVLTLSARQAAMSSLDRADLLAMIGFILVTMLAGWLAGGSTGEDREVLASASSMRNVALAVAISAESFPDHTIQVPLVAFSALMVPPNMLFLVGASLYRRWKYRHDMRWGERP